MPRYDCLVLDHDDTCVKSIPCIHYPSYLEAVRLMRPGRADLSLEAFIRMNCEPGIFEHLKRELCFSDAEMKIEQDIWRKWTRTTIPEPYEGMREVMESFRAAGGVVCVSSHSETDNIRRDYRALFGFEPEIVFGWETPRRKPDPYVFEYIARETGIPHGRMLMVDDLAPGMQMASAAGVDFRWAGWSQTAFATRDIREKNAPPTLQTTAELQALLLT